MTIDCIRFIFFIICIVDHRLDRIDLVDSVNPIDSLTLVDNVAL